MWLGLPPAEPTTNQTQTQTNLAEQNKQTENVWCFVYVCCLVRSLLLLRRYQFMTHQMCPVPGASPGGEVPGDHMKDHPVPQPGFSGTSAYQKSGFWYLSSVFRYLSNLTPEKKFPVPLGARYLGTSLARVWYGALS